MKKLTADEEQDLIAEAERPYYPEKAYIATQFVKVPYSYMHNDKEIIKNIVFYVKDIINPVHSIKKISFDRLDLTSLIKKGLVKEVI